MKRRSFIVASVVSLLGIGTLSLFRWLRNSDQDLVFAQPKFLSLLCDDDTIKRLGSAYLKLKPDEGGRRTLLHDLVGQTDKKIILGKQDALIAESQIEKSIIHDFETDNVVVVQGWVLSVTEARQCAFFSILNK